MKEGFFFLDLPVKLLEGKMSLRGSGEEICLLTDEPVLCACGMLVTCQGQNNHRLVSLSQFSPLNWSFAYWNERLWNSPPPPPRYFRTPSHLLRSSGSVCVQPTHSLPIIASSSGLGAGPGSFSSDPLSLLHTCCVKAAHATRVKSLCALVSQHPVCAETSLALWSINANIQQARMAAAGEATEGKLRLRLHA